MRRLLPLTLVPALLSCAIHSAGPRNMPDQLVVGALLSLSGPAQTLGRASAAALELAADELNARFSADGSATRVSLRIQDTRLNPALAVLRLKALTSEGVRIVVGPQSSSEVAALKPFADSAGVLILSHASTASSLSSPGDNVFRLVPDDWQEGIATVAVMWGDGIRVVVPLWRDDAGNSGLHASIQRLFEEHGGRVTGGAAYAPSAGDFTTQLQAIRSEVAEAIAGQGAAAVAVYLAAFEESAPLLAQASRDPLLARVRWYGGDGTVQSAAVLSDSTAAAFAASVRFRAPSYGLNDGVRLQHADLIDAIEARSGYPADAFALAAYDALHVAALAYRDTGLSSAAAYKAALMRIADGYAGATGPTRLNAAGDRAAGDYDFYQVCPGTSGRGWKHVAAYRATIGTIVPVGGC